MTESFGAYLRRERELREIPIEEIAKYTNIKARFITALEKDDLEALPHITFVRGYIRSYAKFVGLDINDTMLRFDAFLQEYAPERLKAAPLVVIRYRTRHRWGIIFFAVLTVGLFLYGYWITYKPDISSIIQQKSLRPFTAPLVPASPKTPEAIKTSTVTAPENPEASTGTAAKPEDTPKEQEAQKESSAEESSKPDSSSGKQHLKIKATGLCWLQVKIDDQPAQEFSMKPGNVLQFDAEKSLRLFLGNAGGVEIEYNGRLLEAVGTPGQPKKLRFPPEQNTSEESPRE